MTDVKCKVESCYYWANGDVCKADSIMVDNNTIGSVRSTSIEAGNLDVNRPSGRSSRSTGSDRGSAGSVGRGSTRDFEAGDLTTGTLTDTSKTQNEVHARTSHETLCSTFRPKGSEPKH